MLYYIFSLFKGERNITILLTVLVCITLYSNVVKATVISVTQCNTDVLYIVLDNSSVYVVKPIQLANEELLNVLLAASDDGDYEVKADEEYPVYCPKTAWRD